MRRLTLYILAVGILVSGFHDQVLGQKNRDYQYALIEAVKQKNLGNIQGAIELYKMVLSANDSVAVAYYELGTLYILTKQIPAAEEHLEKAWKLAPGNEWYMNAYSDVLAFQEKFKEASRVVQTYMDLNGERVEEVFKLANIYFVEGKNRQSLRILNRLEKEHGVSDKIILLKANIYEKSGKLKKAVEEIDKLLAYFPESVEFRVVAAEMSMEAGEPELATRYYKEALELDSTNIFAITNLTDYYQGKKDFKNSLYYLKKTFESDAIRYDRKMAILGFYLNDESFVLEYAEEIEGLITTMLEKYPKERDVRLLATDFFIQQNNYDRAFTTIFTLLENGEKNYTLWKQGILLANAVKSTDSLYLLSDQAVELFPDSAEMRYFKGIAAYENEKYETVINTFSEEWLRSAERDLRNEALILKAESYHRLEQYSSSDSLFRSILKENPDNYLVMNNFSYYLSLRGEHLDEARKWSYKTITENPENGIFLDTYAWILFKLGEYERAEEYINRAILKGGQNDPDIMEHAGDIQKALKSYHIARSFYEKAIILGGDRETLQKKLEELDGYEE
jgi:tetratricopeptide (TPR) repeat protein